MKVRSHLILTVVAALLPLAIFSTIGLKMLLDEEREAALNRVRETVRATSLLVDQELTNAQSALHVLSTSYLLSIGSIEAFHEQARQASRANGTWTVLLDRNGQQLANTLVPFGTPLPRIAFLDYSAAAVPNGRIRVTHLLTGPVRKNWVVALELAMRLPDGKEYVLSHAFTPEHFNRLLGREAKPEGWVVALIDQDGTTIARSQRAEDFVGRPTVPEVQKQIREGISTLLKGKNLEGVEMYAVHGRSTLSGWTVIVGVPGEQIEGTARNAVLMVALGLLTALACATAIAILFGRRLVLAIQDAERSASGLGHGLAPRSANSGVVEVDRLNAVLNQTGAMLSRERASRQKAEAERTRLLVAEQEARRLADAQNRQKDEFMAMLGHELRNPLAAIAGALSVMEAPGIDAGMRQRALSVGRRQAAHLSRIVDDLLDAGRIMAGKIELKRQPLELSELLTACVGARRSVGENRHVWSIESEPVWVDADPTRLEQVFENLLGNAEKYTPEGGRIDVAVKASDREALVEIRDTGVGIAPELLSTIFDPFVQGPTSIDRAQGGLGLGLALVRQLVRLHGGSIDVTSEGTGTGSTFTLRLAKRMPPASRRSETAAPSIEGNARQVAIVEDNEDGRLMLAAVLELHGFRVHSYANGEEAVRGMLRDRPAVAIIDIGLPGMSGYDIARHLRQSADTSTIRLVALTGYGMERDRADAREAGFDVHLTKPYTMAQLLEAMAEPDAVQQNAVG